MRLFVCASLLALLSAVSPKAQPLASLEEGAADLGAVSIHVEEVYYDVDGETTDALAAQLGRRGPKVSGERYFGLTEWEVHAEYRWDKRPSSCRIKGLRVRASVQTHLPRWQHAASAPEPLGGAWERFLTALHWHERGHRVLAEDAAEAIRVKLATLRAPTCARVEARAYSEMDEVLNEYEMYNREYDATTDHGRSQGATWPPKP